MRCVESIAQKEGPHDDEPESLESHLLSVGQLYEKAPEQHSWIVRDYIPRGALVMLASEEKTGKSTLVGAMIASMMSTAKFLGRETAYKIPVLMLAVEEHWTDLRIRSEKFGLQPNDPVTFYVGDLPNDEGTLHELTLLIKAKGIGLVVLDTLGHQIADVLESENDNSGAIKALKPWLRMARDTNAAILLIHHTGKNGASYRGASSFGGIVDQILTLRNAGGNWRDLESRGRYWETPRHLRMVLEGTEYRVIG